MVAPAPSKENPLPRVSRAIDRISLEQQNITDFHKRKKIFSVPTSAKKILNFNRTETVILRTVFIFQQQHFIQLLNILLSYFKNRFDMSDAANRKRYYLFEMKTGKNLLIRMKINF